MADVKVLALVGSLRAASVNRQLAELAADTAPDGVAVTLFDGLGELPFYNEDIDNDSVAGGVPAPVVALRTAAADADAALVVTPENNGSIPAVLKNAIDWLSRPFGQSVLAAKPVGVIGAAASRSGGARAHDDTRRSFNSFGSGLPRVVESITLSVPIRSLDGKHPGENAEVADKLRDLVGKLAAEVS
ncbi:MAG: NAD(P)H-dependent oxidoreductase [Mycobacterium sp.]